MTIQMQEMIQMIVKNLTNIPKNIQERGKFVSVTYAEKAPGEILIF